MIKIIQPVKSGPCIIRTNTLGPSLSGIHRFHCTTKVLIIIVDVWFEIILSTCTCTCISSTCIRVIFKFQHASGYFLTISYRRHLMSEADEDEELLDDELGDKVITMFSENPWCKLSKHAINSYCTCSVTTLIYRDHLWVWSSYRGGIFIQVKIHVHGFYNH